MRDGGMDKRAKAYHLDRFYLGRDKGLHLSPLHGSAAGWDH